VTGGYLNAVPATIKDAIQGAAFTEFSP